MTIRRSCDIIQKYSEHTEYIKAANRRTDTIMAKSQRTKIQIMVEITLERRPKISNTNTTTETFEDTKLVSKRCKWIKGKQYIIQAKRDNNP